MVPGPFQILYGAPVIIVGRTKRKLRADADGADVRPRISATPYFHLPLSRILGGGTLSSSDGQRFPVAVKTANATALPKYFGYGRGLTFYTWTSDQYSQFGTKVIPATMRDATVVLDEILDNETELPLLTHATDTAGYTEILFSLFDLLGYQFAPRLRDLGDQVLYRIDGIDIPKQIKKGEALHSLRRYLFVANEAQIRKRHPDDQLNQVACLNLVTNAVVVWNTVYMWEAIEQLKRESRQVDEADVRHLSPALYEHINVYGKYLFPVKEELSRRKLRPPRNSGDE